MVSNIVQIRLAYKCRCVIDWIYYKGERPAQGLHQLTAGYRKPSLEDLSRGDIAALTPDAAMTTRLRDMDVDKKRAEGTLDT